ncbi:hypothetical protein BJV74DRAFT_513041 [Russula compacta]|nr:hypothetical protein BJV74DRAFT_513041 [Russula compacta]
MGEPYRLCPQNASAGRAGPPPSGSRQAWSVVHLAPTQVQVIPASQPSVSPTPCCGRPTTGRHDGCPPPTSDLFREGHCIFVCSRAVLRRTKRIRMLYLCVAGSDQRTPSQNERHTAGGERGSAQVRRPKILVDVTAAAGPLALNECFVILFPSLHPRVRVACPHVPQICHGCCAVVYVRRETI